MQDETTPAVVPEPDTAPAPEPAPAQEPGPAPEPEPAPPAPESAVKWREIVAECLRALLPQAVADYFLAHPVAAPARAAVESGHELAVGDPVKVWQNAAKTLFLTGTVAQVHGDGHAYDVQLADQRGVTTVPAAGLEYDGVEAN